MLRFISRAIIGLFIAFIVLIGAAITIGRTIPRELEIALHSMRDAKLYLLSIDRGLSVGLPLPSENPQVTLHPQRYTFGVTILNPLLGVRQHLIVSPRHVTPYPTLDHLLELVWLSDGSTLQTTINPRNPHRQSAHWVQSDGTAKLWFSHQVIDDLILSPDERWITFSQTFESDPQNTYLYDRQTRRLMPFNPDEATFFYEVAWSPDSQWLAAVSRELYTSIETLRILVGRPSEQAPTRLIDPAPDVPRSPSWSPDQQRIAFEMNHQIYVIGRDATGLQRLELGRSQLARPIWLSDGRMLLTDYGDQIDLLSIHPDHPEIPPRRVWRGQWIRLLVIP
ncbi:MAG: hypothetical protein MUF87_10460 [Anaerolineae bacterium]|nr:hypothetical protein [Anaerolineae bacterium]